MRNIKIPDWVAFTVIILTIAAGISLCKFTAWNNSISAELYGHYAALDGAIHDYQVKHAGDLPGSLDALIAEGYYEGISSNPYTGKQMIVVESPQQIRTGTIYFEAVGNSNTGQVDECWFTI